MQLLNSGLVMPQIIVFERITEGMLNKQNRKICHILTIRVQQYWLPCISLGNKAGAHS